MLFGSLKRQFVRDLKASWQKSALLAALFIVGLVFWVPPLVRALQPASKPQPAVVADPAPATRPPVRSETTFTAKSSVPGAITWENVDELLDRDPLVRSAEVAALQSDPFRMDQDQFSPPILFSNETVEAPKPVEKSVAVSAAPDSLALKSTIVGVKRRAAYINTRLYFEGSQVRDDQGATYLLTAVYPRKVLLERDGQTFELKIASVLPFNEFPNDREVTDDTK